MKMNMPRPLKECLEDVEIVKMIRRREKMEEEKMLQFFKYDHLPPHLQEVSKPFWDLAYKMVTELVDKNPERTAGLRKLLEAKDCMVRATFYK